jgi:hypothetical protein
LTIVEEEELSSKVGELMTTLDQVKKYKELARSVSDFALILLSTLIAILFVYIGVDLYQASGGQFPQDLILSGAEGLFALIIFGVAFVFGTLWLDRRSRRLKVGEWKKEFENDETVGAMKILAGLDWPSVFQDIRYSKIGFVFYSILKIIGYSILVFILIFLATGIFLEDPLHIQLNFVYVAIVSLILVLVLSRKDLQRRYNQSWALDSLLWELRWFDSEFREKAEFGSDNARTKT